MDRGDRRIPAGGRADDLHAWLIAQQVLEPLASERLVIDDQYAE
jgi:hypothetical protein